MEIFAFFTILALIATSSAIKTRVNHMAMKAMKLKDYKHGGKGAVEQFRAVCQHQLHIIHFLFTLARSDEAAAHFIQEAGAAAD